MKYTPDGWAEQEHAWESVPATEAALLERLARLLDQVIERLEQPGVELIEEAGQCRAKAAELRAMKGK